LNSGGGWLVAVLLLHPVQAQSIVQLINVCMSSGGAGWLQRGKWFVVLVVCTR